MQYIYVQVLSKANDANSTDTFRNIVMLIRSDLNPRRDTCRLPPPIQQTMLLTPVTSKKIETIIDTCEIHKASGRNKFKYINK